MKNLRKIEKDFYLEKIFKSKRRKLYEFFNFMYNYLENYN